MTLTEHIAQLESFVKSDPESASMQIVFHDPEGCAFEAVDIHVDGTCTDEEVVRISIIDPELESELESPNAR